MFSCASVAARGWPTSPERSCKNNLVVTSALASTSAVELRKRKHGSSLFADGHRAVMRDVDVPRCHA